LLQNHSVAHIKHKDGCLDLNPDFARWLSCIIHYLVEDHDIKSLQNM